jgi:hypothetical protein
MQNIFQFIAIVKYSSCKPNLQFWSMLHFLLSKYVLPFFSTSFFENTSPDQRAKETCTSLLVAGIFIKSQSLSIDGVFRFSNGEGWQLSLTCVVIPMFFYIFYLLWLLEGPCARCRAVLCCHRLFLCAICTSLAPCVILDFYKLQEKCTS